MYPIFFRAGKISPALLLLVFLSLFPVQVNGQDMAYAPEEEFDEDDFFFGEGEGITIVGTLQTSQNTAVIEKDEIERRNAPDLATLLQESLDLNITRYGSYGSMVLVNMRGLDSKRLAFLVDGVPVNSSIDGRFDIEQIDINSIERIEVIYGGSDTRYNVSGAMGGVINIITVKKQKSGLRISGTVSNTSVLPGEYRDRSGKIRGPEWEDLADTQNAVLSAQYGRNNFSVNAGVFANRAQNHFLFTDRYGYTRRKDNNEVWDTGMTGSLVWDFSNLSKLIISPYFYYSDKNIPGSGFSSNAGKQQDISSRNNIMFDMPRAFRDDLAMEASLGWKFLRKDYTDASAPANTLSRHDQQNSTLINRWSWYPGDQLVLRSGFDYSYIRLDSTEVGRRNRHDAGIYLTAEYRPIRQFIIIPSVKAVYTSEGEGGVIPVPKLGFLWNINDDLSIKNNYFRSFKFPDFEDLYWKGGSGVTGNSDLKPEDGWGGDLGLSWRYRDLFSLDSTLFTQWLKDSIHWYPKNSGVWQPENAGEAIFFGLDSKISFDIPVSMGPVKKIVPSFSYQYLLSYLLSFGYRFASDKRIPYNPLHTMGGSLDIPWETGSLLISGHYESLRYSDRANLSKLKPYFLLNANLNQSIGKNFAVFAVLRNILNTSYESFSDYPMPGISLTLGMRAQFKTNQEKK